MLSTLLASLWVVPPLLVLLAVFPLWAWTLVRRAEPPLGLMMGLPLLAGLLAPPAPLTRAELVLFACAAGWPLYAAAVALAAVLQPGEPAPGTLRRWPVLLLAWGLGAWASLEVGPLVLPFSAVTLLGLRESARLSRVWTSVCAMQLASLALIMAWFSTDMLGQLVVSHLWSMTLPLAGVALLGWLAGGARRGVLTLPLVGALAGWLGACAVDWILRAPEREIVRSAIYEALPVGAWQEGSRPREGNLLALQRVALEELRAGQALPEILVLARADARLGSALRWGLNLVYRTEPGSQGPLSVVQVLHPSRGILIHPDPSGGFVYDDGTGPDQSPSGCEDWFWVRVLDPAEPWTAQQVVTACEASVCVALDTVPVCVWSPDYGWHFSDEVADCVDA
jgi:hypothetical protein